MFCPVCSQEQASNEVRFCSTCGFLLTGVSQLIVNGGAFSQPRELKTEKTRLTRKSVLKLGAIWLILMWFILVPIGGIFEIDGLPELGGVLGFAGMLISLLVAFLFLSKETKFSDLTTANFQTDYLPQNLHSTNQPRNALPPQQSVPVSTYVPPQSGHYTTSDLTAVRGSVTDPTTKLLNKDE